MKPTVRFSNRAENYRKYRPGYPPGVIELIRRTCSGDRIADVGSGTGIFTRILLEASYTVTAVEPNPPMRRMAEQDLSGFPGFTSVPGTAEETGLTGGSFCAITVAQAFHWFEVEPVRREFLRILEPRGWVFLIWNHRIVDASDFSRDYEELLRSLGESYRNVASRDQDDVGQARLKQFFGDGEVTKSEFNNPHVMDWAGLKGRFLSSSYVPAKGDPRHEEYVARLEDIFLNYERAGKVTFAQSTVVYSGRLA